MFDVFPNLREKRQGLMKRVFGIAEAVFNVFYLITALILSIILLTVNSENSTRTLAGVMALFLVVGDSFHLVPRIAVIITGREEQMRKALGTGKQAASVTMTIFYLLLWQIGLNVFSTGELKFLTFAVYALAAVRIFFCLLPQNKWQERHAPTAWGIARNIPFFLLGAVVAALFFTQKGKYPGLNMMWAAIALSFVFYLPVVLWSNKNPKVGMLMLLKTCAYLWMLMMCLSLGNTAQ